MVTNLDILHGASIDERKVYVYMWLYRTEKGDMPFYVGIGTKNRYKNKSSRSKKFKEFISTHECYPILCATHLTTYLAREVEKALKSELQNRGVVIIDAEDNSRERMKRVEEGIAAMPIVNGKRVSTKTGNEYGRPAIKLHDDFQKFLKKQKDGELSVRECCEQLGISRATWYNRLREVS